MFSLGGGTEYLTTGGEQENKSSAVAHASDRSFFVIRFPFFVYPNWFVLEPGVSRRPTWATEAMNPKGAIYLTPLISSAEIIGWFGIFPHVERVTGELLFCHPQC